MGDSMDTKIFIILASACFGLILLGAIVGNVLESQGVLTKASLGPKGTVIVMSLFFVLFCVLAFSLVPLVVKAFIAMQIRIGNGELFLVKWVRDHERTVIYGIWGFFGFGLSIAFTLARDEIMKQLR